MKLEMKTKDGIEYQLEVSEEHVNVEELICRIFGLAPVEPSYEMSLEESQSIDSIIEYANSLGEDTTPNLTINRSWNANITKDVINAYRFTDAQVCELYQKHCLSIGTISAYSDKTAIQIRSILVDCNILIRHKLESQKIMANYTPEEIESIIVSVAGTTTPSFNKYALSPDEIVNLYEKGYSVTAIANVTVCHKNRISEILKLRKIRTRGRFSVLNAPISDSEIKQIIATRK